MESAAIGGTQIGGSMAVAFDLSVGGDARLTGDTQMDGDLRVEGWLDAPNLVGLRSKLDDVSERANQYADQLAAVMGEATERVERRVRVLEDAGYITTHQMLHPLRVVLPCGDEIIYRPGEDEAIVNLNGLAMGGDIDLSGYVTTAMLDYYRRLDDGIFGVPITANAGIVVPTGQKIQIGDATIEWDATNQALKASKAVYTEQWLSAFGANGESGGGGIDMSVLESYAHINGRTITIGGVSIYVPTETGEGGGGELTMSDVAAYINGLGYATQQWVTDQGYLTSHQSLSSYATKSWVQSQGYLTEHQSLAAYVTTEALNNRLSGYVTTAMLDYYRRLDDGIFGVPITANAGIVVPTGQKIQIGDATIEWDATNQALKASKAVYSEQWLSAFGANGESGGGGIDMGVLESYAHINGRTITIGGVSIYVPAEGGGGSVDLTGYATEQWVQNQGYLTAHQSLTAYATKTWVQSQGYLTAHQSLAGYATQSWVTSQGYLTAHQSLTAYATKTWVQNQGYLTEHQSLAGYATTDALSGYLPLTGGTLTGALHANGGVAIAQNQALSIGSINLTYDSGYLKTNATIMPASDNVQLGTSAMQFQRVRAKTISNSTENDLIIAQANTAHAINLAVGADANTILAVKSGGAEIPAGKTLTIGGATISWDATAQALKIDKPIYSEQWISAYGANGGAAGMAGELTTYMWPSGARSAINTTDIMAMTDAVYAQLQSLHLVSTTDEELGTQSMEVRYSSNLTLEDAIARCVNEHGMDYGRLAVVMAKSIMQYLYQHVTYEGALTMGAPTNTLAQRIKALENAR